MVLIGTVDGRMFLLEEAIDMIRAEFKKFSGPMSVPQLHERTNLDPDGIVAILCYMEFCREIKQYITNQIVKWI